MSALETSAAAAGSGGDGVVRGGASFARRLGPFDVTMLVMGGIVGSGIFANPHEVALEVSTPALILGAWVVGGVVALLGAFVYAELAARRPEVGGQYAFLREAYHPSVAFLYGWALLLVTQTGGMAAVAVIFGRFFRSLTGVPWPEWMIALAAIALLTAINCLGVRAGSSLQNVLMVLKIGAVLALIAAGLLVAPPASAAVAAAAPLPESGWALWSAFGAALAPVLFAYGGWQTAGFVSAELRDPRRDMPRGLLLGVSGVIALYLAVNFVCVRVLGVGGLAASGTPASDVMRAAFGGPGARWIEIGITVSTLGFLSQGMLTAPRVYYAMAKDGLFFRRVGELNARSRVPVVATILQGITAMLIAAWGKYSEILVYGISMDFLFFGITGAALFALRRRDGDSNRRAAGPAATPGFRAPGHPWTTALFTAACLLFVVNILYKKPREAGIGLLIVLSGLPVYAFWRWLRQRERAGREVGRDAGI